MKRQNNNSSHSYIIHIFLSVLIVILAYCLFVVDYSSTNKNMADNKINEQKTSPGKEPLPFKKALLPPQEAKEKVISIIDSSDPGKNAERFLDQSAISRARIEEVQEEIAKNQEARERLQVEEPLTDIAPPSPVVDVSEDEHPYERIKKMNLPPPAQATRERQFPKTMNIGQPPRWNKTLAAADHTAESPDPFTPPPMFVDITRAGQP